MKILCMMFGHIPDHGYYRDTKWGGSQYFEVRDGHTDGIKREHWSLYGRCRWCNKKYRVGRFHGPLRRKHPYGSLRFMETQKRIKTILDDVERKQKLKKQKLKKHIIKLKLLIEASK